MAQLKEAHILQVLNGEAQQVLYRAVALKKFELS
jgi:hypothetical protein